MMRPLLAIKPDLPFSQTEDQPNTTHPVFATEQGVYDFLKVLQGSDVLPVRKKHELSVLIFKINSQMLKLIFFLKENKCAVFVIVTIMNKMIMVETVFSSWLLINRIFKLKLRKKDDPVYLSSLARRRQRGDRFFKNKQIHSE